MLRLGDLVVAQRVAESHHSFCTAVLARSARPFLKVPPLFDECSRTRVLYRPVAHSRIPTNESHTALTVKHLTVGGTPGLKCTDTEFPQATGRTETLRKRWIDVRPMTTAKTDTASLVENASTVEQFDVSVHPLALVMIVGRLNQPLECYVVLLIHRAHGSRQNEQMHFSMCYSSSTGGDNDAWGLRSPGRFRSRRWAGHAGRALRRTLQSFLKCVDEVVVTPPSIETSRRKRFNSFNHM